MIGQILKGLFKQADEVAAAAKAVAKEVPETLPHQTVNAPAPVPAPAPATAAAPAAPAPKPAAAATPPAPAAAPKLPPSLQTMRDTAMARARTEAGIAAVDESSMALPKASATAQGLPVEQLTRQTSPGAGPRNYNLYQFQTTDDALAVIQKLAADRVGVKGVETRSWEEVRQRAQPYTYQELMGGGSKRSGMGDVEVTAAAQLLGGHVERLTELNNLYRHAPHLMTEADKLEMRLTATRAASLESLLSGKAQEAGRILSVLKMAKAPRGTASAVRAADATLLELGGNEGLAALSDLITRYEATPKKLVRAVKQNEIVTFGQMAREYAINNMFSVVTHARNIGGNFIAAANDLFVEGPLEAGIGAVLRPLTRASPAEFGQRYLRDTLVQLRAIADGFGEATTLAKNRLLERSEVVTSAEKVDIGARPAITGANVAALMERRFGITMSNAGTLGAVDVAGFLARRHTNLLGAMDAFFRSLNTRKTSYAELYDRARQSGLSHGESMERMRADLELPDAEDFLAWEKRGEELIFAQPLSNPGDPVRYVAGMLNQGLANHPWAKFIAAPFLKTPANLGSWIWRRTPGIGLLQKDTAIAGNFLWNAMLGDAGAVEAGGAAAARVLSQQAVGVGALVYIWDRVDSGDVSGLVGVDPGDSRQNKLMNVPTNSLILKDAEGNKYGQSISGIDPLAGLINLTATMRELYLYAPTQEDAEMVWLSGGWVLGKVLVDRQFLSSFEDIINLIEKRDPKAFAKMVIGKAATFIPFAGDLRRLEQLPDENLPQREGDDDETLIGNAYPNYVRSGGQAIAVKDLQSFVAMIGAEVMARSPYFNKDLPYQVNGWGEPLLTWGNYIERNVSPSYYQPMNSVDVQERDKALYANGIDHPEPGYEISVGPLHLDVREVTVDGKPPGWAWQDYQETIGKARAAAVDAMLPTLDTKFDSVADVPGYNREKLIKALQVGLRIGQAKWLAKPFVQEAFKAKGVEFRQDMLQPEAARTIPRPLVNLFEE